MTGDKIKVKCSRTIERKMNNLSALMDSYLSR